MPRWCHAAACLAPPRKAAPAPPPRLRYACLCPRTRRLCSDNPHARCPLSGTSALQPAQDCQLRQLPLYQPRINLCAQPYGAAPRTRPHRTLIVTYTARCNTGSPTPGLDSFLWGTLRERRSEARCVWWRSEGVLRTSISDGHSTHLAADKSATAGPRPPRSVSAASPLSSAIPPSPREFVDWPRPCATAPRR